MLQEKQYICFGARLETTIGQWLTQEKPGRFWMLLFMLLYIVRTQLAYKKIKSH